MSESSIVQQKLFHGRLFELKFDSLYKPMLSMYFTYNFNKGKNFIKKESDVGMLLTGIQSNPFIRSPSTRSNRKLPLQRHQTNTTEV